MTCTARAAALLTLTLTAIVALPLTLGACKTPLVRPATFRARPDSVKIGDLRGPFDGRVVDAETGRPVAGALVHATWSFVSGTGLVSPAGYGEWLGSTDSNGRYKVPRLDDVPRDGKRRLADFRLVIYKRGYVAYRSDRRFEDLGPRTDFSQVSHQVDLQRWRSDYSHVKHLRYVGGGAALAELTAWEVPEAARELSDRGRPGPTEPVEPIEPIEPVEPTAPPLRAEVLLRPDEVKKATGYDGAFDVRDLGDEPTTSQYDSVHLQATGKDESWDVALRLWHLPAAEAVAHYDRMKSELPGVRETNEVADRSLRAATEKGEILGIAFVDEKRGVVALLQCGAAQCKTHDVVLAIARLVADRVQTEFTIEGAQ